MKDKKMQMNMGFKVNDGPVARIFVEGALIQHKKDTFRILFWDERNQTQPGTVEHRVAGIVNLTPVTAKSLAKALTDNIAKYEKNFGEIEMPKQAPMPTPQDLKMTQDVAGYA